MEAVCSLRRSNEGGWRALSTPQRDIAIARGKLVVFFLVSGHVMFLLLRTLQNSGGDPKVQVHHTDHTVAPSPPSITSCTLNAT